MVTGERSDEAGKREEAVQAPAARRDREIEALERHREADAERLDVGLLARPDAEEAEQPVARRERGVTRVLERGEELDRDRVGFAHRTDRLDVDAHLGVGRKSE